MSLEDFEYGRVLGKGVFGSVLIVKRKEDNEIYAMKRVKIGGLTKKELENSFNEVRLLASLNHKNVIGYREAFYDQQSKTLNIVMEYADDGDLSTKIKQAIKKQIYFDEQTIWSTLIQILEGLKYLHKSDIIHRDLKSANIFLTKKGGVKIGDLNVSKIIGKSMAITQTGTPYYASPEIWNDHPYDYKCDIWSAGCIIYEMASLKMPFRGTSMQMLYNNVMKGNIDPIPSRYSVELMEIIKIILTKNPNKRPSAEELLKNPIILQKMEKFGVEQNLWNCGDEKAMLIRTIKIPRNLNQMNQINGQLPRKNYKKERYQNQLEMLENDEYETAKNSFYHPNDKKRNHNKKKNNNNSKKINTINKIYYEPCKKTPLIDKKIIEQNMTDIEPNSNIYGNNKYNCNYNYNVNNKSIIRSKSNINKNNNKKIAISSNNKNNELIYQMNYKNQKELLKKINNYINNKKEEILSPQQIMSKNRKYRVKNSNTESLRISTSNVFTTDVEKSNNKVATSINEPIKLINNRPISNSINNAYCNKEEKRYVPISSINNGNSFINSIFESQINKLLNKKINVQNSISSIQQQSRQRQNKYISNPSCDNILKDKKIKTLETHKKRIIKNNYNINKNNIKNNVEINYNNINKKSMNREIMRNRSCKGAIYKNPLLNEDNLVEDKLLIRKKKKLKNNQVRRNISTDYLNRKNSMNNYNECNYRKNNSHIIGDERSSLKDNLSNNARVRRIKQQLEDILPPFEFEKIFRNRLLSANNDNTRKKNNVNVKININNNYNYINNVNMDNNNNNNYNTENKYQLLPKNSKNINNNYEYYYNNKKSVRPKSTSSIINNEKYINNNIYRPPPMQRYTNVYPKDNKNNLTEINDNFINNDNNNNNSSKKYKEFYNFYYHKFLNEKMKNSNNSQKLINLN